MPALEIEPPPQLQLFEFRRAIHYRQPINVIVIYSRKRDPKVSTEGHEFESTAIGSVDSAESLWMGVADARAEIGREAEVGGDVSQFGEEKAMVGAC